MILKAKKRRNTAHTLDEKQVNEGQPIYYLPEGALFKRWPMRNVDTQTGSYIPRVITP